VTHHTAVSFLEAARGRWCGSDLVNLAAIDQARRR